MPYATAPSRHRFNTVRPLRIPSVAALLVFAGACGQGDAASDAIFTPEVIGTAAVPLSESDRVALLADERTACAIDSYEGQIRCVDSEGAVAGVFGRKGEGPGEFGRPGYLARGEEGTVGVVDSQLGRFTVFARGEEGTVGVVDSQLGRFTVFTALAWSWSRRAPTYRK